MSLTHAILGVLEARPMSGYELARFFDDSMAWVWSAPQSQIYPRLRRMSEEGLVEGESNGRGRVQRTIYRPTERGIEELRRWVTEIEPPPNARDENLLRAVFFDEVDPAAAIGVLQGIIAEEEALIDKWRIHRQGLLDQATPLLRERLKRRPAEEHEYIAELKAKVFDYKLSAAQARIEWAEEMLAMIEARATGGAEKG
jgi:DNA-binding PadR family transcriptional regulator